MKNKRSGRKIKACIGLAAVVILAALYLWMLLCEKYAHKAPEVQRVSILEVLKKEEWNEADLALLEQQTGLMVPALKALEEQGRRAELPQLQEAYFAPVRVACEANSILSREEYLTNEAGQVVKGMRIPVVENGDILITVCSHAFGWRNGHAAMVVDADKRMVLEAQVLGSPTVCVSLEHWECYPSFRVLRLKDASPEERDQIAAYAKKMLTGIPYRLTAGIWQKGELTGTQCAHLVWYAYRHFGYDLDSDGGSIVTPADLAESELLETVQCYGM